MKNNGIMNSRPGQCYMWAWRYLQNNQDGTLVHAQIWSPYYNNWMGHAWVECENDNFIYDPTTDRILTRIWWTQNVQTKNEKKYTWKESVDWVLRTEHYGSWEDEHGNVIPLKKRGSRK